MNLLKMVSRAFITAFGITQPGPEQERRAAIFICAMLLGAVILVIGIGLVVKEVCYGP